MFQRLFALAALLVLIPITSSYAEPDAWLCNADSDGVVAASPCLHVMGRTVVAPPDGSLGSAGALLFDWPGVVIEARFMGSELKFLLAAENAYLEACVDGDCQRLHVTGEMKAYPIVSRLKRKEHRLRLSKVSETIGSQVELGGFVLGRRGALLPTGLAPVRQIEFIGDSYTVGYGVESPGIAAGMVQSAAGRECDDEQLRRTTNTQRAQAVVAARWLTADYQVNAFSGLGMVRAYNGSAEFLPFPHYYDRALMNRELPLYNPALPSIGLPWKPQAVVIALGTNDFSTALQPHEADLYSDRSALRAAFLQGYADFLDKLRKRYSGVRFFLVSTNLGNGDELSESVQELIASQKTKGHSDLVWVDLPATSLFGCHWHPDLGDQGRNGRKLAEKISEVMGWSLRKY